MPEVDHTPSPTTVLIRDFRLNRKRLLQWLPDVLEKAETLEDLKGALAYVVGEIANGVYPSLIAEAEQIAEVDEVIQEVVDQQESYLHPELSGQIFQTLAIGGALAGEVRRVAEDLDDDLKRKKLNDLVDAFVKSSELTEMAVNEASSFDDDDDDDDDDENRDDEDPPVELPLPETEPELEADDPPPAS